MELSTRYNQPISWHYNDEIFNLYDWTKEPQKSLTELYQERALQIRKKYDYVILFYSGGADSHNMLESFLRVGADIDEIVSIHSYSADRDRNSQFNREIFETAIPYVQNLKQSGRLRQDIPHRLIDMSDLIVKFSQEIDWLDFPYIVNSAVSINNVARSYLRKYITDWANLIDQGKKVALIWGHDKPRIMQEQGKFFLNFMDIFDNCISTWIQQTRPPGWFDEMFYSTPDLPELVIKQAHVIKNFLTSCPESHCYLSDKVSGLGHVVKYQPDGSWQSLWLTRDAQSTLLYPWFDPDLYNCNKVLDIIYSSRDHWFWSDLSIGAQYHTVINGIISKFGDLWLNHDLTNGIRATRNFRSQKYWLNS